MIEKRCAVRTNDLDAFLRAVRTHRENGNEWPDIAPLVAHFWSTNPKPNGHALYQYVYNVEKRPDCPAWWPAWWASRKATRTRREPVPPLPTADALPPGDQRDLAELLEADNVKLRDRLAEAERAAEAARRRTEAAERRAAELERAPIHAAALEAFRALARLIVTVGSEDS